VPGTVALVVGGLYVRTAARDIVFGDSPELVGVAASLGVAHAPGYPLWTILGHIFTLLPLGPIPFRVSLFSVAAGIACALVVYVIALRLTRSALASAAAALMLSFAPVVWTWSVVPEVFALADLIAAVLVLLLLVWHETGEPRYFVAAALVGGIGMAHHQTIAFLGPAILVLMGHHRRRFRGGRLFGQAVLASVAGLLPYAYLPIGAARHTAWSWGELASVGDFVGQILRVGYGTGSLVTTPAFQGGSVVQRLGVLAASFTVPEAILGVAGLAVLYRRDRAWFWFASTALLVTGPAFTAYSNINLAFPVLYAVVERFFLLPHVILAPCAAVGIRAIADTIRSARARAAALTAVSVGASAMALGIAIAMFPAIDQSEDRIARSFAEDILSSTRKGAILLGAGDPVVGSIGYLQTIEGVRPDVTLVQMPLLWGDWYIRQLRREHPDLKLTFDKLDGARGTLRVLVEANGADRFDVMGSLVDESLAATYALERRGLIEGFRPKPATIDPDAYATQNDSALRGYRVPASAIPPRPWDRLVLNDYALAASDVGDVYQRAKRYAEARQWYQRALALVPDLAEAKAGLATLPPP
jgi:dolichyl-phosphate-mannose-protein mannosyltransferase